MNILENNEKYHVSQKNCDGHIAGTKWVVQAKKKKRQ